MKKRLLSGAVSFSFGYPHQNLEKCNRGRSPKSCRPGEGHIKTWKWVLFLVGITLSMSSQYQGCPNTIWSTADAGGTIVPLGGAEVDNGSSYAFFITPDEGYEIKDVLVDGKSVGAVETYVFKNVWDDHSIHATFRKKAHESGYFGFSEATFTVNEGAGFASVVVTRYGGFAGAVGVRCSTADGTAKSGEDYTYTSNTLTWGDGDSGTKTVTVAITDDSVYEPAETFTITLTNPSGGAELGTPVTTTITISNNDT
jgi:hypothetical protein